MRKRLSLSLGIPVYNQCETIEETLTSVLDQTEEFDEIVVVDNHSNDGTSDRLKKFAAHITIVSPPEHLGIAKNWNYCVSQLNGDWFSLLSGDDKYKRDFVLNIKKAIESNSEAALIRSDWEVIDGEGKKTAERRQHSVALYSPPPFNWRSQLCGPKVSFAAFAARKNCWNDVGGFPTDFNLFHDWMFWLLLAKHGPFIRVPKLLAEYRIQERPVIDIGRLGPRIDDEHRYISHFLPRMPWGTKVPDSVIRKAARFRLRDVLNALSRHPEVIELRDYRSKLMELSVIAGIQAEFEQWCRVPAPISRSLVERMAGRSKDVARLLLKLGS